MYFLIGTGIVVVIVGAALVINDHLADKRLEQNKQLEKSPVPNTDNQELDHAINVYKELVKVNYMSSPSLQSQQKSILEAQQGYVQQLQKLDISSRNEKAAVELQNFKMIKSFETFSLCCTLIQQNPLLMEMLFKSSEEEGVEILRQTINFDDDSFNKNKNSLKQIVSSIKKGLLSPIQK